MDFDYDHYTAAAPAVSGPAASGISVPPALPTSMFGGSIPAVRFGAVSPLQAAVVAALHGPIVRPVYEAGLFHRVTVFSHS